VKGSRIVFVAGASAVMLAAGWRVGSLPVPTLALADPASGQVSTGPTPSPTVGASTPAPMPSSTSSSGTKATTTTTTTTTTAAPAPAHAGATGTYVGPSVNTAYGAMQVQLVITGGKITKVQPLTIGYSDRTSQRINANAVPTLQQRVLKAQTYKVAYVSGASYTSEGFLASVKGAMAKAGL
jgi:uncharacterized protein with FMN-binding domain